MKETIVHFRADETMVIPPPNGPIRMGRHWFFGGANFFDTEISAIDFIAPLVIQPLESAMTTAEGGVIQIGPVSVSGGTAPYSYQWYKNGATANNASSKTETYTSGTLSASDNGAVYKCVVTDSNGKTADSNDVTITVTSI